MTEILKFIEEIHAEFPQILTIRMVEIWFKQQNIPIPIPKNFRPCERCKTPHCNRKDNYCNYCRGGILKFGKHKKKSFRYVLNHDIGYCEWAIQTDKIILRNPFTHEYESYRNFLDFKKWLKEITTGNL